MAQIFELIVLVNATLALITVFRQPRDIAATWAWMLVLVFLPVIGFLIYAFAGRKLPKKRLFRYQDQNISAIQKSIHDHLERIDEEPGVSGHVHSWSVRTMMQLFKSLSGGVTFLAENNDVEIFVNGNNLFDKMLADIDAAQDSIHMEFYTFYDDAFGRQMLEHLVAKARHGVDVHVIYDSLGSFGTTAHFFKPLRKAGGRAEPFLKTHSPILDFRLNFRDHRKIVVIDGRIGYIGGYNIGDQYLGRSPKFGPWRDTHLRILGPAVMQLQAQFILDWNATDLKHPLAEDNLAFFDETDNTGSTDMQIVSSGPDSDEQQIKMGYIRLIQLAKQSCWIQTPYLIPDDSMIDALRIAASAGIDVRIMVPDMPDHPFVYRATQYYAQQLTDVGVKVYYYQEGFLHAKTVVVDGEIASVGSANFDFRSFKLNFEINAFLYDQDLAQQLAKQYQVDMASATLQTPAMFEQQSWWLKFKQQFSRLLSPIL
ncbi:cardiolipin synthase [Lactobacillaceae bacterium L1_55_11]|nr:cardiolipin synthase [Lactobacillaceae bacterium L1_55_11]